METAIPGWTLTQIAEMVGGTIEGPPDFWVKRLVPAHSGDPEGIAFAENEKYLQLALASGVGALLLPVTLPHVEKPSVRVANPRDAFFLLLKECDSEIQLPEGIHATAVIADDVSIDPRASVGAYVVIEQGSTIAAGAKIHPFTYVGARCTVEEGACLMPHVVLLRDVRIGPRAIIHSGTVLGADGFGYFWNGIEHVKIPQIGGVDIGADVEIGALTAIDASTVGDTLIGNGSKIDNLVQIAHNVRIGDHCIVAGQCGITGGVVLGKQVTLGGGVGFQNHVTVGDQVSIGARAGVGADLQGPGVYWGSPAMPIQQAKRVAIISTKLPEMLDRIRALEKRLVELEKDKNDL